MKDVQTDERDDERGIGAEHLDLVLNGEEEHPLLSRLLNLEIVDDSGDAE
jgi:hypothetical protein